MCRLASFIYNPKTQEIKIGDIISHASTYDITGMRECAGWYEGHYLPDGEIQCRTPLDSGNDTVMEEEARRRWPSFTDFFKWCISTHPEIRKQHVDDGKDNLLYRIACIPSVNALECANLVLDTGLPQHILDQAACMAACGGGIPMFKFLLSRGASARAVSRDSGKSLIHLLICNDSTDRTSGEFIQLIRTLAEQGCDVRNVSLRQDTALNAAAYYNLTDICQLLIDLGADLFHPYQGKEPGQETLNDCTRICDEARAKISQPAKV